MTGTPYDAGMRIRSVVGALALISSSALVVSACGGSSEAQPSFTGHGWVSAVIGYGQAADPASRDCDVTTKTGTLREGSKVTVLVGSEVVGSTALGAGSFTEETLGYCKWEFTVPINRESASYTVRIADGTEKAASATELKDGTFSYGATAVAVS